MSSTTTGDSTASSARSRPRAVAFVALTAAFIAAAFWHPSDDGIPLCALKRATGVSCPGCGMTRGLAAMARGEPGVSIRYHAFAPLVALGALAAWVALGLGLITGRNLLPDLTARRVTIAVVAFTAAFLLYWLIRLWTRTAP